MDARQGKARQGKISAGWSLELLSEGIEQKKREVAADSQPPPLQLQHEHVLGYMEDVKSCLVSVKSLKTSRLIFDIVASLFSHNLVVPLHGKWLILPDFDPSCAARVPLAAASIADVLL